MIADIDLITQRILNEKKIDSIELSVFKGDDNKFYYEVIMMDYDGDRTGTLITGDSFGELFDRMNEEWL